MVIVLMGPEGPEVEQLGVELAAQLGWRCIDADAPHSSGDLHVVVASSAAPAQARGAVGA